MSIFFPSSLHCNYLSTVRNIDITTCAIQIINNVVLFHNIKSCLNQKLLKQGKCYLLKSKNYCITLYICKKANDHNSHKSILDKLHKCTLYMNIASWKKNSTIKRRIEKVAYIIIRTQKDMIISVSQCGSVVSSAMHIAQFNQSGVLKSQCLVAAIFLMYSWRMGVGLWNLSLVQLYHVI